MAGMMRHPFLIDGRHALDGEKLRSAGFEYTGIS